jgi:hypothetical protein
LVPSFPKILGESSLLHGWMTNLAIAIAMALASNSQDPHRLWLTDSCECWPKLENRSIRKFRLSDLTNETIVDAFHDPAHPTRPIRGGED